jgi:hypothetical protein
LNKGVTGVGGGRRARFPTAVRISLAAVMPDIGRVGAGWRPASRRSASNHPDPADRDDKPTPRVLGDDVMQLRRNTLRELIFGFQAGHPPAARRPRRASISCDWLEGRVTPTPFGTLHTAVAVAHFNGGFSHANGGTGGSGSSSSNSALTTALQTLRKDVLTIELASSTTVGQLAAIRSAFQTLSSDGLSPSSRSALTSFENSLVTAFAAGTTLTGNATLLSQFEALYTSSPTAQQTTDLTTAYNALAAAVTSSNITSANITTINTDWAAVLAAEGNTSTATFPYFSLVTGQGTGAGLGGCG